MKCPYCAEEIKDGAIACRYCNRDFFVIQPLMAKLKDARSRIRKLERALAAAGVDPDADKDEAGESAGPSKASAKAAAVVSAVDDRIPTLPAGVSVALTITLLVVAHYIIIVQFDLALLYLRIVSIAIPLVIGFLYRKAIDRWLAWDLVTGLVIAVVSILIMSTIVSLVDKVPVLPQDMQGWREYAEYTASIGFGFFAGCVLRHGLMIARAPSRKVGFIVELISRIIANKMRKDDDDEEESGDAMDKTAKKVESLVSGAIAAGSVVLSIYTGLSGLLGE